jgi:hypothetical protein
VIACLQLNQGVSKTMDRICVTILVVALTGCAADHSDSSPEAAPSGVASTTSVRVDTPQGGSALVTAPDSFVHESKWSPADSIVGEFVRFAYQRHLEAEALTSESAILPGDVQIGRTTTGMLKALLGKPALEKPEDSGVLLQYDSPFIGPDEEVLFHFTGDTLRRISWTLYSDE